MISVPAAAVPLYALPPSRFVAARNALAKELAARGDGAAQTVRKLPRPTGLAWLMNRLARERSEDVEALLAAADRLRAGQRRALAGEGAEGLRAAEEELRDRARKLRAAAGAVAGEGVARPGAAALARLELLLRVAATSAGPAREGLRAGVLAREPDVAGGELSGFAVVPGGADVAAGAKARPELRRGDRGGASAARAALAREERRREQARRKAAQDLARAEAAAARAEREADRAAEVARRAAERAAALRGRAGAAREAARRLAEALRGGGRP